MPLVEISCVVRPRLWCASVTNGCSIGRWIPLKSSAACSISIIITTFDSQSSVQTDIHCWWPLTRWWNGSTMLLRLRNNDLRAWCYMISNLLQSPVSVGLNICAVSSSVFYEVGAFDRQRFTTSRGNSPCCNMHMGKWSSTGFARVTIWKRTQNRPIRGT